MQKLQTVALTMAALAASVAPVFADDDVAALVVDNGPVQLVPESSSLAMFAIGLSAVAAYGVLRHVRNRRRVPRDAD